MSRSLRAELLAWLLLPLAAVVAFNGWSLHRDAMRTADLITDRTLLASARVIAEQVKEADGRVEALIPPSALEMFASPERDKVIYRVLSPSGELIAGFPDVVAPPAQPRGLEPAYYEGTFRTEAMRAVALAQPVISKVDGGNALVIVATTLHGRDRLVDEIWQTSLRDQLLLVGIAALLTLFGLHRGLAPLLRLRDELRSRDPESLKALDRNRVQGELRPVIDALNHALDRVQAYIALQRRFVADASHQLRTPLAVLKTQVAMARRDDDSQTRHEALAAIDGRIDSMARLVNQLLTLARAEPGGAALRKDVLDFNEVTRTALESLAGIAFDRAIDLSFEAATAALPVRGHVTLLRELVLNLVENALRHIPQGSAVAVKLEQGEAGLLLVVEDNGPGIPEADRERVFQRFHRLAAATVEGTGLGLAIVREIVTAHDGTIALMETQPPPGLRVEVRLPAAPGEMPAA
ncbi:MAG: sensor histidine kinase N-terminal domain-containing protein [Bosea sp.]|uniref:sensor histidine kinase n=1 Tax=Bosea sp. (in: a-proteobacteria) TaxID=1871050 RepID=UPI001AC4EB18|nr:sensor histidine kinase [Bosea sp. (in: a-proteobacteria)]MBN9454356.1 sensor histidine kinase N-terminal domain-containing protein [Bosea sp. (in: a-proteobacteria)]